MSRKDRGMKEKCFSKQEIMNEAKKHKKRSVYSSGGP